MCLQHDEGRVAKRKEALSVDHIVPYRILVAWKERGEDVDPNHLDNLVCLCRTCHQRKTTQIEGKLLKGDIMGFKSAIAAFLPQPLVQKALEMYKLVARSDEARFAETWTYEPKPRGYVPNPNKQGERHHNARLNEDQVRELRARKNEPRKNLAKEFGISVRYASSVVCGRKWAHIALLFLLASLPSLLSAQVGYPVSGQAVTPTGTPVYNAQLTLCSYTATGIPCTPQANMYSDAALTHLITQPYATNQYGNFNFWVAPNVSYLLQIKVSSTLVYSYYVGAGGTTPPVGLTIQTNSVNNFSQSLLNFTNGTGTSVSNPSGGIEQINCNTTGAAGAIGCSFIPLYGNGNPSASCSAGNISQEYYDLTPSNSSPQIWICKQTGTGFAWQQLANSAFPYPGAGVPLSTGSSWGTSFGVQGTDSNVLTSGTVSSSPGSLLCVDANNGATTAGCAVPTGVTFQHNGSATGINQAVWNANDSFPTPPAGNTNVTWQHDQSTGSWSAYVPSAQSQSLQMQVNQTGQYAIIYPTGGTITLDPPGYSSIYANGTTAAGGHFQWQCSGLLCSLSGNVEAHWTGFALPAWLAARTADITAIYADATTSAGLVNPSWGYTDIVSGTTVSCNGQELMVSRTAYPYSSQEVSQLTTLTGANFNSTAECHIQVGGSGPGTYGQYVNVSAIRFIVFYTGTPGPANPSTLNIQPPLYWVQSTNTLGLDLTDLPAGHIGQVIKVSLLPLAATHQGSIYGVYDGINSTDCTVGGGSSQVWCGSNGSVWAAWTAGGSGGMVYPGVGIPLSTGSAWGTSYAAQGTDSKLLTAGTISGTGATLCTDANGGATTTGCAAGGGSVTGSGTAGYLSIWTSSSAIGSSLADYGITAPSTFTFGKQLSINDGSGNAGAIDLVQGTGVLGATNALTLTVPSLVTAYRLQLPGAHPSGSNTFLSCTAADPSVCSWAAASGGGSATVASAEVVTYSATPTFSTAFNVSRIVLTGNITSFTMSGASDGQSKTLCFKQGAGPYTVAAPASVHGFFTIGTISGDWNCQSFVWDNTDSIWQSVGPGTINQ